MKTDLIAYLRAQGLATSTAGYYARNAEVFLLWCLGQGIAPSSVSYSQTVGYLSSLNVSSRTRHLHLLSLRYLMAYQQREGHRADNPAEAIHLHGLKHRLPHNLLTDEQLWQLYREHPQGRLSWDRDREILGLLALQGLQVGELKALQVEDLDLPAARVRVPSSGRSRSRVLKLEAEQILPLLDYLDRVRPLLLATCQDDTQGQLFLSSRSSCLAGVLFGLSQRLSNQYPWFERLSQLRSSRIALWVSSEGLRKAQHLAGHRHVSSTERYQRVTLEALKRSVSVYHPLR